MMIPDDELLIEAVRPPSIGGQQCGVPNYPVRVTHIPTGTKAECGIARSQHVNRMIAIDMILSAMTHPKFYS